jgi:CysZ protein
MRYHFAIKRAASWQFEVKGEGVMLFDPIYQVLRGLRAYPAGILWLMDHKRYFFMLLLPMLLGFLAFAAGTFLFVKYAEEVVGFLSFARPSAAWGLLWYYLYRAMLYLSLFIVLLILCILTANAVAAPLYDVVSLAVERSLYNEEAVDIPFFKALILMFEEIKKVSIIMAVSVLLLVTPGLNLLSPLVSAFLLGWDFYDYPLVRRGWRLRERLKFVLEDGLTVMGFGFWLLIPFVQIILLPFAVPGGTMLSMNRLKTHAKKLSD